MKEVIVVIDDKVVRVPRRIWKIIMDCAGQMITDGDIFDYYDADETKQTLNKVGDIFKEINN